MNCAHKFCIYNRDFLCVLEEVNINSFGICDDCIIVNLEEDFLETQKKLQLATHESN